MRSITFGFIIQTRRFYEAKLNCSQEMAVTTMARLTAELDGRGFAPFKSQPTAQTAWGLHAETVEVSYYDWDEDVTEAIHTILGNWRQDDLNHLKRMQTLRHSLRWMWPQLRETMILGHYTFATTVDGNTLLSIEKGWNTDPDPGLKKTAYIQTGMFFNRLSTLGVHYTMLGEGGHTEDTAQQTNIQYGPRMDTISKLETLLELRQQYMKGSTVQITREMAWQRAAISRNTWRKYAPTLYKRWYDVSYEGGIQ